VEAEARVDAEQKLRSVAASRVAIERAPNKAIDVIGPVAEKKGGHQGRQ
jgi:hypothetical protein